MHESRGDRVFLTSMIKRTLSQLVDDLASARYEQIENSGRSGRLSAVELNRAITSYGRTLTPLPDRAWDLVDVYPSASNSRFWYLDLPL